MIPVPVKPRPGAVYLLIAAILFGASWPLARYALLQGANSAWFALGRIGLSAIVSVVLLLGLGRLRWPLRRDWPSVLAIGLLQIGAFFALSHAALQWVSAGRTGLLANCTIVFTVPLSLLVLGEPISGRRWLATGLGMAGIVVLVGPWAIDWRAPHLLVGTLELMGAALAWALAMLIVRRYPPRSTMFVLLPWSFIVATFVLLPVALMHEAGHWPVSALVPLLLMGVVIAPVGTWCLIQAQVMLPIVVASVGFLAAPVLGVVLAALFLGETMSADIVLGAGLVLLAAGIAATKGRRA